MIYEEVIMWSRESSHNRNELCFAQPLGCLVVMEKQGVDTRRD